MMRKIKYQLFTLVELMVAMAILVIMMGFLFEFVIGAQRIWSASSRKTSLFETAQIVFSLFEQDFQNAIITDEPGRSIPCFVHKAGQSSSNYPIGSGYEEVFCWFVSQSEELSTQKDVDKIGACPILYFFIREEGSKPVYSLYRVPIDKDTIVSQSIDCFDYIEADKTKIINNYYTPIKNNRISKNLEKLADNVVDFNIEFVNDAASSLPRIARITLTLFSPQEIKNYYERVETGNLSASSAREAEILLHSNTFSKILFLN